MSEGGRALVAAVPTAAAMGACLSSCLLVCGIGESALDAQTYVHALLVGADLEPNAHHWRVDPFEPNRVWFTTR